MSHPKTKTEVFDLPLDSLDVIFSLGVHLCLGNRLAEMQLRVLWEELLARKLKVEFTGEPKRTYLNAVRGFTSMLVRIASVG